VIETRSELGLIEGNGNHCDYFVGELRVAPVDDAQAFLRVDCDGRAGRRNAAVLVVITT
jgi:hypothetical protein